MSIIAYAGLPGAGKSYSAVANVIIPQMAKGRTIYHNLELVEAEILIKTEGKGTLVQIQKDWTAEQVVTNMPPGAVVILDEVWQYWRAGIKANEVPDNQMAFFKEHRHSVGEDGYATEMLILDQDLGSAVAKFIHD